mmetsp:Transcript_39624/g.44615  ORF Transcript_39624/g.44615 Transcript_39624/m.44615 type:complete len:803 (-) Transcript_39624:2098-4506(-)
MFSIWFMLFLLSSLFCDFMLCRASASLTSSKMSIDLSYLHNCPPDALATTIREILRQQQQQQRLISPKNDVDHNREEDNVSIIESVVDIDLSASLIGKNISGILEAILPVSQPKVLDESVVLVKNDIPLQTRTTFIRFTARRNQFSPKEAIVILNFILENNSKKNETMMNELNTDEDNSDDAAEVIGTDRSFTIANHSTSRDDDGDKNEEEDTTNTGGKISVQKIQSLDLGWNNFGRVSGRSSGVKSINKTLRRLLSDSQRCPPSIRLNSCGLCPSLCRDIAKGIVERYDKQKVNYDVNKEKEEGKLHIFPPPPLVLDLACNEGIGDAGVAALAAAIRTVASQQQREKNNIKKKKKSTVQLEGDEGGTEISASTTEHGHDFTSTMTRTIFERLDLSGCKIGDVGAEALAIALENNPLCIQHLDLSNNQISDVGAVALARALGVSNNKKQNSSPRSISGLVETLDLSNNKDLSDRGARELSRSFQSDTITNLILRSCNIQADGASCFGNALRVMASQADVSSSSSSTTVNVEATLRRIDLSGNPLGILTAKKSSGNKYSATALRSKATATTAAYMNIIGKKIRGISENIIGDEGLDTLESDDDDENRMEGDDEDDYKTKCGALSLAEAFIDNENHTEGIHSGTIEESGVKSTFNETIVHFELGLRHCSFDTRAAEALAAVLQESRQKYPRVNLIMDMTMNNILEEDIIASLHGKSGYNDQLADMAENYLDVLEVLREARERALKATQLAAARAKAVAEREMAWGSPPPSSRLHNRDDGSYSDDEWGSGSDFNPSEEGSDDYNW